MDASRIEKFIDAGYTKKEIDLLFSDPKIPPEASEDEKEKTKTDTKEEGSGTKEFSEDTKDYDLLMDNFKSLSDTVSALSDTVKALQKGNIDGAVSKTPKKDSIIETMQSFVENL